MDVRAVCVRMSGILRHWMIGSGLFIVGIPDKSCENRYRMPVPCVEQLLHDGNEHKGNCAEITGRGMAIGPARRQPRNIRTSRYRGCHQAVWNHTNSAPENTGILAQAAKQKNGPTRLHQTRSIHELPPKARGRPVTFQDGPLLTHDDKPDASSRKGEAQHTANRLTPIERFSRDYMG